MFNEVSLERERDERKIRLCDSEAAGNALFFTNFSMIDFSFHKHLDYSHIKYILHHQTGSLLSKNLILAEYEKESLKISFN